MRTTLDIPEREHALFTSLARQQGVSFSKLVVELALRGLKAPANVADAAGNYDVDPETGLGAPLIARSPVVVVSDVRAPPSIGPVTANACALVSAKLAAPKLPSVPILFAPLSVALPTELPVSVVAVIAPAVWLISRPALNVTVFPLRLLARIRSELAPVVLSVRSPAPPLADGALLTVRVCVSLKLKLPPLVNAPSAPTWLAPASVVLPTELPVNVAAVITPPAPSLIAPAEVNVVAVPFTAALIARSPVVVVSVVLAPPSIGPVTANACALVSAKLAAPKLPSVPILFAPLSVALPTELPVSVVAVIAPAVWLISRPALNVTVFPLRLLARIRSELAPVVLSVRSRAPPLADGALLTVRVCALVSAKFAAV